MWRMAACLMGALLVLSCGDGVSTPVPQPVPGQIRISSPALTKAAPVLVLGLAGAVAGAGKVHVKDLESGALVTGSSNGAGSFSVVISVNRDHRLEARFENADGISGAVSLALRGLSYGPGLGTPQPGVVSKPDAQGQVKVSNDGGAGKPLLMSATANVNVLISNAATAQVVTTQTDKDGRFSQTLSGARGDSIQILLVDPQSQTSTSNFVSILVP